MSALTEPAQPGTLTTASHPLLLFFDGECAFCNRWVNRLREVDQGRQMRFGAKQGHTYQRLLQTHPELAKVDSVVVLKRRDDGGEDFLVRSAAIRVLVHGLPEFHAFDLLLRIVPTPLAELGYRIFAKFRVSLFGKAQFCHIPPPQDRELYVD